MRNLAELLGKYLLVDGGISGENPRGFLGEIAVGISEENSAVISAGIPAGSHGGILGKIPLSISVGISEKNPAETFGAIPGKSPERNPGRIH